MWCFEALCGKPPGRTDVFFDLGSGDGRLVTSLAVHSRVGRCVGVELCPPRHALAIAARSEAERRGLLGCHVHAAAQIRDQVAGGEGDAKSGEAASELACGQVELYCTSMLEHELDGATHIFSYNLPQPGGIFLKAMKRHLLRCLKGGAYVLLRGQYFPTAAQATDGPPDAISFLRDRSSWSVRILSASADLTSEPQQLTCASRCDVVRARFQRLELRLQTQVVNRLFQYFGYRLEESEEVTLQLGSHSHKEAVRSAQAPSQTGDDPYACGDKRGMERDIGGDLPVARDEHTRAMLAEDERVGHAVRRWIEAKCSELEATGDCRELRSLELRERRERLGDSSFERAVLDFASAGEEDDEPLCIWTLPDDF